MKKLVKRLMMAAWALVRRDDRPKVLFYHDVGTRWTPMGTPVALFRRHLSILKAAAARGVRHRICFDDAFRGLWDVRDELREAGFAPTVFVPIRLVGAPGYLTWDEIRTLQNDCGFAFQCHTWSHQTLAGPMIDESPREPRTEAWFRRELVESKAELERRLGRPVTELCFPVGNFSEDVVERCRAAGYTRLYTSYPGCLDAEGPLQPRCLVQDFSPFDLRLALAGGMGVFRARYLRLHYSEERGVRSEE